MKLTYFGTAAYEGFPALGCTCDACKRARKAGGRNIRSRCQAMVNDDLLLDFPADTMWHFMQYNIDFNKIKACLISHSHSDHLYVADVEALGQDYTRSARKEPLHFYAGESGYEMLKTRTEIEHVRPRADATLVKPFGKFSVAGYGVLPLKADHAPNTSPLVYRIEKDGKSMLFAHDTGVFCEETWENLEKGGRLDLVSLDCTGAVLTGWTKHHLTFDTVLNVLSEMERRGIIDGNTVRVVNHFSHNSIVTYDEMVEAAKDSGVLVAYDGMEIEF